MRATGTAPLGDAAEIIEETGGQVIPHVCDIRDPAAIATMIDAIWAHGPSPA